MAVRSGEGGGGRVLERLLPRFPQLLTAAIVSRLFFRILSIIGSSLFSPHINVATVQHWSSAVKKFLSIYYFLCVLALGRACRRRKRGELDHTVCA